jgi:hypothetical protein
MNPKFVFEKVDGEIITLAVNYKNPNVIAGGDAWVEAHIRAKNPDCKTATRLPNVLPSDLPQLFRAAWRNGGTGKIRIDMPLARVQRMAEIRAERNTLLDASDKEKARIDDVGTASQKTAISAYRQALRDLPATINLDAIDTPEALDVFEPAWPVMEKL